MKLKKLLAGVGLLTVLLCGAPQQAYPTVSNTAVQTTTGYGDGVTTHFVITFDFRSNSWVTVTLYDTSTNPATVTTVPQQGGGSGFSIAGGNPGTTVVMGTAPTSTQYLIIRRSIPLTQPVAFNPASIFPYQGLSSQLDQVTLTLQNLNSNLSSGGSTAGGGGSSTVLPTPGAPYDFIGWNAGGNSTVNATVAYDSGQTTFQTEDILKFNGSGWATYAFTPANLMTTLNLGTTPLGPGAGGTGVSNSGFLTWGSNALTFTTSGVTNVTLPTSGTLLAGTATNNNVANTFVKRDSSGNFSAGTVTANLAGNVTGNVTGNLTGNASGTAANITGVAAIGNGGTGQTTQQNAINALLAGAAQPSGSFARWDGANVTLNTIQIGDIPTGFARSKLAQDTANTIVTNDASGNMSVLTSGPAGNCVVSNGVSWVSTTCPGGGGSGTAGITFGTDSGVANAYVVSTTDPFPYQAGATIAFVATNANTTSSTINVSGGGVVNLVAPGNQALVAGDIQAGQIVVAMNDGTRFQLISPQGYATAVNTASQAVKRDASGNFAAGTITANLTGTASTATTATNGTTVAVSNSASYFPLFSVSSTNGSHPFNLGTGLTFNPSTNVLATTTFSGALSGNATTATALASTPTQCSGNNWATGVTAAGNGNCSQVAFSNLSGTATAAQGGTGITTAASTGVPSISSGTWSVNATLPTSLGGLGGNFGSSTGALSISSGTVTAGVLAIVNGGTGGSTASTAINGLLPSQTSNGTKFLYTDGSSTSWSTVSGVFSPSEVIVDSCNGYGTSSKVLRYSNIRKNVGSDITYADNAGSAGGTFTINTTGVYAVTFSTGSPANGVCGITVNNSSVNTNPQSLTYAQGLRTNSIETANGGACHWTGNLSATDVVQMNSDGNTLATDARCMVDVVRVH